MAGGLDGACDLVPQGHRSPSGAGFAFEEVHVGAAHPAPLDSHPYLTGTERGRFDLLEAEIGARMEAERPHHDAAQTR